MITYKFYFLIVKMPVERQLIVRNIKVSVVFNKYTLFHKLYNSYI